MFGNILLIKEKKERASMPKPSRARIKILRDIKNLIEVRVDEI
tara:strand:- start:1624 stop:1752 length:129 start_codon:yes stop_codon:yes gene_type:complete